MGNVVYNVEKQQQKKSPATAAVKQKKRPVEGFPKSEASAEIDLPLVDKLS